MNVKDMLRQASDAAKQIDNAIGSNDYRDLKGDSAGSTDSYGGGTRCESPRSGTYGPGKPKIRPVETDRGTVTGYSRRYGERIDITFSIN